MRSDSLKDAITEILGTEVTEDQIEALREALRTVPKDRVTDGQRRLAEVRNFVSAYGSLMSRARAQAMNYAIQGACSVRLCKADVFDPDTRTYKQVVGIFHGFYGDPEGPLAVIELTDGSVVYADPSRLKFKGWEVALDEDRRDDDVS